MNKFPFQSVVVEAWEEIPSKYGCVIPHHIHRWELMSSEERGFTAICVNEGCESIRWYGKNFKCWKEVWLKSRFAREFKYAI